MANLAFYRLTPEEVCARLGLPAGTSVVGGHWNPVEDVLMLEVEHEAFPPIPDGRAWPVVVHQTRWVL